MLFAVAELLVLSVAVHFFPKKVEDLFLVVVTFKRTLNVQTSKQRGKKLEADQREGPLAAGGPSHGTTGTMDNPALLMEASYPPQGLHSYLPDRDPDIPLDIPL